MAQLDADIERVAAAIPIPPEAMIEVTVCSNDEEKRLTVDAAQCES